MKNIKIIVLLIILSLPGVSFSIEKSDIRFKHISLSEGLSQSTVYVITQDHKGFLWVGTQDGLNRFDGYNFTTYRNVLNDSTSLMTNYIRTLYTDKKGDLWIGSNKGLSRYDFNLNTFINYPLNFKFNNDFVSSIVEDENGMLWVGSKKSGLLKFNRSENKLQEVKHIDVKEVNSIVLFGDKLLLGSEDAVYTYSPKQTDLKKIFLHSKRKNTPVLSVIVQDNTTIWIGTEGDGLIRYNPQTREEVHYIHKKGDEHSLSNDNIRSLSLDDAGNLWVGTFVGLNMLKDESFITFYDEYNNNYSISQNSIRSIYRDNQGGMWFGTFFGGLNYYNSKGVKFKHIFHNGNSSSVSDNVLSDIIEDRNGNVWIATNDEGVDFWNRKTGVFKNYKHSESNSATISSNNIKSLLLVDSNTLLIGTHNKGLNVLNIRSGNIKTYQNNEKRRSIAGNNVYSLLKDNDGNVWVGTWDGLDRFDMNKRSFVHVRRDGNKQHLTSNQISVLFEDSQNRIWIGTVDGLNIFYPNKNEFEKFKHKSHHPKSISSNEILSITEDSNGCIWIGTRSGLNRFNEKTRRFKRFTVNEGLPNNVIFGVVEDSLKRIWVSTNAGLSMYDKHEELFKNYTIRDGLQSNQFNNYSYLKLSNNEILFGGVNGLTIFSPKDVVDNPFSPSPVIKSLKLFDKEILPGDDSGILSQHIDNQKSIKLKYDQNVFSVEFVTVNYPAQKGSVYSYTLEGFDREWYTGLKREVTYSNLNPGDYTFRVKSCNNDGVSNSVENTLNITVLSPWWLTSSAFVVYVLFFLVAILLLRHVIKIRLRLRAEIKLERLEKEKMREINKMKIKFFTNISHEFRTPISLIISPVQKLLERGIGDEWHYKQLKTINSNARNLLRLIDQLMHFRKSELGLIKLKVSNGDVVPLISNIYNSFTEIAKQRKISYKLKKSAPAVEALFDGNYIERIVYNLLSNAFKFTADNKSISISIESDDVNLTIRVKDAGRGIPQDQLSNVFERFFQIEKGAENTGTGIGLAFVKNLVDNHHGEIFVESKISVGTTFTVNLPLQQKMYENDEILDDHAYDVQIEETKEMLEVVKEPTTEEIDAKQYTILLVEDNYSLRDYLNANLSEKFNVVTSGNGKEALERIEENEPNLVLSDVMMPIMDGVKLCKKIKKNIKLCHIPVVLLTAKFEIEDQLIGLENGADDYISKPFNLKVLESRILNILNSRTKLKEMYSKNENVEMEKLTFNVLDEEFIAKSMKVVEENILDQQFSVERFSSEMGMSRSNLHLKLKAITGESATDFIKKIRFKHACALIKEGRHSMAEISFMVGFNSPSYFSTSFKKYFGHLPTEYLERLKKS